jgi:hypothetical protein
MRNKYRIISALAAVAASMTLSAQALIITAPSPSSDLSSGDPDPVAAGVATGMPAIFAEISGLGITLGSELYKQDQGGGESGPLGGSYQTTFANEPNDPADFLIHYVGGDVAAGNPLYLLVKDGSANPAWYLYDITSWNGTEDISGTGFWVDPPQGAISHVSLYGGSAVPEGGSTLVMLGSALTGLSLIASRRKLARNA